MKKINIIIYAFLGISLLMLFDNYFDSNQLTNAITSLEINKYRIISLIYVNILVILIKMNEGKHISYVIGIILYCFLPIYLYMTKAYFQIDNSVLVQIRSRILILLFLPSIIVLCFSWILQQIKFNDKLKMFCWVMAYLVLVFFQVYWIFKANTWAINNIDFDTFFKNYKFVEILLYLDSIIISFSYVLKFKFDKSLFLAFVIVMGGMILICILGFFSKLNFTQTSIINEFVLCQLPVIVSLFGSMLVNYYFNKES